MLTFSFEQQIDCIHSIAVMEPMRWVGRQLTNLVLKQTTENSFEKSVNRVMDNLPKNRKQEDRDLEEADKGMKEGKSRKDSEEGEKE